MRVHVLCNLMHAAPNGHQQYLPVILGFELVWDSLQEKNTKKNKNQKEGEENSSLRISGVSSLVLLLTSV